MAANSCGRGGCYTVATEAGRFVGNIYNGTRLEAALDAGPTDFVAFTRSWKRPPDTSPAPTSPRSTPTCTYFIRFAFGE